MTRRTAVIVLTSTLAICAIWFITKTGRASAEDSSQTPTAASQPAPLAANETARLATLDAKPLQQFASVDLAEHLQLRGKSQAQGPRKCGPSEMIAQFALKALDQPYYRGGGRFDLAVSDCVTFTERSIVLSLSRDWDSYYKLSERLRHKDGVVAYRNRNFDTLGDWVPNNAWLLRDITTELGQAGAKPAQPFSHLAKPKVFKDVQKAAGMGTVFVGLDAKSPEVQARTFSHIPRNRIREVLPDLRSGDVFLVIVEHPEKGWYCDHLGVVVRDDDAEVNVVHSVAPKVLREPLTAAVTRWRSIKGLAFLRLRDNAQELVDVELAHLHPSIVVVPPAQQDEKTRGLRAALDQERKVGRGLDTVPATK